LIGQKGSSDYKILARIIAQRLLPVLADHLTGAQFCGVPGNTILGAVATLRDIIAYEESRMIQLCVLSLDFKNACDGISHDYLFQTLQGFGIGDPFISGRCHIVFKFNGRHYGPIPICFSVRQGWPMSMALYALCLHPFRRLLELKLPGIRIGCRSRPTSVVAYADDVIIFVTSAADFTIIEEAIHLFERASGAQLNPRKSKSLALGSWSKQDTIFGIAYHPSVSILGVTSWGIIEGTMKDTWARKEPMLGILALQAGCVMSTPFSYPKSGISRKFCRP